MKIEVVEGDDSTYQRLVITLYGRHHERQFIMYRVGNSLDPWKLCGVNPLQYRNEAYRKNCEYFVTLRNLKAGKRTFAANERYVRRYWNLISRYLVV